MYDENLDTLNEITPAKRIAGEYEITHSLHIGDKEVVFGENQKLPMTYFCAHYTTNELFQKYADGICGDDYVEMVSHFAKRIADQCAVREKEQATEPKEKITAEMCLPNDYRQSIVGKVVAVKLSILRPEYHSAAHQLIYVTGGNGAQANARGNACFHYNLYTGEHGRFERYQIEGEVKPECLPDWAKACLETILQQEQQKHTSKEAR